MTTTQGSRVCQKRSNCERVRRFLSMILPEALATATQEDVLGQIHGDH
jgi:hypothetical protein